MLPSVVHWLISQSIPGGPDNNRGTKDFMVEIGICGTDWISILSDTLTSAINKTCQDIPVIQYSVDLDGRYLKFTALDYYGEGSALQYFNVITTFPYQQIKLDDVICPGE